MKNADLVSTLKARQEFETTIREYIAQQESSGLSARDILVRTLDRCGFGYFQAICQSESGQSRRTYLFYEKRKFPFQFLDRFPSKRKLASGIEVMFSGDPVVYILIPYSVSAQIIFQPLEEIIKKALGIRRLDGCMLPGEPPTRFKEAE